MQVIFTTMIDLAFLLHLRCSFSILLTNNNNRHVVVSYFLVLWLTTMSSDLYDNTQLRDHPT